MTFDTFDQSDEAKKWSGWVQSGASSLAKQGGAYFSAVYGSIEDPIVAPGLCNIQVAYILWAIS